MICRARQRGILLAGAFEMSWLIDWSINSRGGTSCQVLILDSRFWGGNTYLGGKFDAFFNVFCIFGVFLGGIWDSGGNPPNR